MVKIYMNGIKTNLREIREHLEFMSELGYRFKELPSYEGTLKFKAQLGDDIINTKEYVISGCQLSRIFSSTNIPIII